MELLQVSLQMVQLIFGLLVAVLSGGFAVSVLHRKKTKAETEQIVVNQFRELTEELRTERTEMKTEIKDLKKDNERCELEHAKTRLELEEVKQQVGYKPKLKGRVFILDDDYDVLHDFKREFKKLSIIDYKGFHDHNEFLESAKEEQPEMLVMDHRLGGGETAEKIISKLGYEPEVIIMSGEPGYSKRYNDKKVNLAPLFFAPLGIIFNPCLYA